MYRRGGGYPTPLDQPSSDPHQSPSEASSGKGKRRVGRWWRRHLSAAALLVAALLVAAVVLVLRAGHARDTAHETTANHRLHAGGTTKTTTATGRSPGTSSLLHLDGRGETTTATGRSQATPKGAAVSEQSHQANPATTPLPIEDCGTLNSTMHWRNIAVNLARLPVKRLLAALEKDDPFGVRNFETALIRREVALGRTLTMPELRELFPCPRRCPLTSTLDAAALPAPKAFREGQTWMLFQHLRKAGGTHFCSLAQANLPKKALPSYYCMPDYRWSNWTCAGCLHHWSNDEMIQRMTVHRVAGNEWDNFAHRFLELPAVLATSFRKPLDRALSQFRFECVEARGCKILNVTLWWERRKDLYNVYTTTFADAPAFYGKLQATYLDSESPEQARKREELVGAALDVVLQLHLVLVMEWLTYAGPHVTAVLGFRDTSKLTQRVRPHLSQRERPDQPDTNALGAAGVAQSSWDPHTYLTPEQYATMSETLALDMILTDAARRIFLERLVCTEPEAPTTIRKPLR